MFDLSWQDWVLGVGQLVLFLALIPSLITKQKPVLSTSIISALVLSSFATTFISLQLWFGGLATTFSALAWYTLAWQRYKQINSKTQNPNKKIK